MKKLLIWLWATLFCAVYITTAGTTSAIALSDAVRTSVATKLNANPKAAASGISVAPTRCSWFVPHRMTRGGVWTCASRTLPRGTKLRVTEIHNRLAVLVVVDDYGPNARLAAQGVTLDLCRDAFAVLAGNELGRAEVTVEILN